MFKNFIISISITAIISWQSSPSFAMLINKDNDKEGISNLPNRKLLPDEYLDLSSQDLGNKLSWMKREIIELTDTNKIKEIVLSSNFIDKNGAEWIGKLIKIKTLPLEKLDLYFNAIGDEGIKFIIEALEENENTRLTKLNLRNNLIGNEGVKQFIAFLERNPTHPLREVDLSENRADQFLITQINNLLDPSCIQERIKQWDKGQKKETALLTLQTTFPNIKDQYSVIRTPIDKPPHKEIIFLKSQQKDRLSLVAKGFKNIQAYEREKNLLKRQSKALNALNRLKGDKKIPIIGKLQDCKIVEGQESGPEGFILLQKAQGPSLNNIQDNLSGISPDNIEMIYKNIGTQMGTLDKITFYCTGERMEHPDPNPVNFHYDSINNQLYWIDTAGIYFSEIDKNFPIMGKSGQYFMVSGGYRFLGPVISTLTTQENKKLKKTDGSFDTKTATLIKSHLQAFSSFMVGYAEQMNDMEVKGIKEIRNGVIKEYTYVTTQLRDLLYRETVLLLDELKTLYKKILNEDVEKESKYTQLSLHQKLSKEEKNSLLNDINNLQKQVSQKNPEIFQNSELYQKHQFVDEFYQFFSRDLKKVVLEAKKGFNKTIAVD